MPGTFSCLHFHIVWATKERRHLITDPARMHAYLGGIFRSVGALPLEIGGVDDHVHSLVALKPRHCISEVLQRVKKSSSDWMATQQRLFAWQDGYAVFAICREHIDAVREYIRNQETHHRGVTFEEEYRRLLIENGVEFDPRFMFDPVGSGTAVAVR